MAKMGNFSASDLKKLQKKLNKIQEKELNTLSESIVKELAARLLAKVIKRTPVGDYSKEITVVAKRDSKKHKKGESYTKRINPSGKQGGTLRRGWTFGEKIDAGEYNSFLSVEHIGENFVIEIINPVEYASYVEYGHRTRDHQGWVQGRFMLTISEQEVQEIAPNVLASKIEKFIGECFN